MRYQAEPGNEGRGKRREKSEAEPLDMRYQALPVNEGNDKSITRNVVTDGRL